MRASRKKKRIGILPEKPWHSPKKERKNCNISRAFLNIAERRERGVTRK